MEKNDLIKFCRYYKGEDVCPSFEDQNIRMLWGYERSWMMEQFQSIRREFLTDLQSEMLDDYLREGLSDFSKKRRSSNLFESCSVQSLLQDTTINVSSSRTFQKILY